MGQSGCLAWRRCCAAGPECSGWELRGVQQRPICIGLSRARVTVVGVMALASGCGADNSSGEQRYSADELSSGVDVSVNDVAGAVDSATVFLPDDLPSYVSLHPQLDQERIAVLRPGEGGFDLVVVYRTGPFCGVLPEVSVSGDDAALTVEIRTRGDHDECDAMEYDEALGLELAAEFDGADIEATLEGWHRVNTRNAHRRDRPLPPLEDWCFDTSHLAARRRRPTARSVTRYVSAEFSDSDATNGVEVLAVAGDEPEAVLERGGRDERIG